MESALLYDRLQFAVTSTFHYLFPQLTMGLALLLVYFRTRDLLRRDDHFHHVARFWTVIFALSFAFGVVTGIPLEFQFGTNWAKFSSYAGGIIGQTLAMEGLFAFFLESSFLGILLFGEGRFSRRTQWFAALMLFLGSRLPDQQNIGTTLAAKEPLKGGALDRLILEHLPRVFMSCGCDHENRCDRPGNHSGPQIRFGMSEVLTR